MDGESPTQEVEYLHYWQALVQRAAASPQLATRFLAQSRQLLDRCQQWCHWLYSLPRPARRRLQRRLQMSLAGAALTLAISQTPFAYAATIPVTTTTPTVAADSFCSLIEAIINANDDAATNADCVAGSGADTITLNGNTYTLTSPYSGINPIVGLPSISSEITIAGADATIERDADADSFGILHVAPSGELTLEQTTITGGESNYGGGIYNEGVTTLTNSTVSTNNANFGGGILNTGVMTLTNSMVSTNTVTVLGGGILNDGVMTLAESTVSGNTSLEAVGGGIYNYSSPYEVPGFAPKSKRRATRFQWRSPKAPVAQARQQKMAAMVDNELTLIHSAVTGNTAYIHGGGIFNAGSVVTLTNSTVTSNTATTRSGGGIFNYFGDLTLIDSTVATNVTNEYGGGILNAYGSSTLTNSTVSTNTATIYDGGGIYNDGSEIGGDLTLTNSTVSGNKARSGGGIGSLYGTLLLQGNSTVIANQTTDDGGGINSYYDTITLSDSTVSNNVSEEDGGGIDAFYSTLTISNSTISGNSAVEDGGGMDPDESIISIDNSTFDNNHAGYSGGAIYFDTGTLTVTKSTISNNTADIDGGGIGLVAVTAVLSNSTVSGNGATGNGGGLFAYGSDVDLTIQDSTIAVNTAGDQGGGLFAANGALATLVKSLIAGNSATNGGNELYDDGSSTITADAQNLLGESSESTAQAFTNFTPSGNDITATSDGTTPTVLAGILNPTLSDNGGDTLTHALVSGSPAIDAAGDSGLATDQRGVTRPQGTADDIGAVEVKALNGPSGSIVQTSVTAVYNGTPQSCPATGGNLPIYTISPTLRNDSTQTFTDLFFRVKTLEYTTAHGGLVPSLCNATSVVDNGGVGSMLAIANSSLPGGNDAYDPTESLSSTFLVGLPIRAQFRINVDLFSSTASAAGVNGAPERYIGSINLVIDPTADGSTATEQLFLPIILGSVTK